MGVTSIAAARQFARRRAATRRVGNRLAVLLAVVVGTLTVVGLGAILSASSVLAISETGDGLFYFRRQLMWLGAGTLALVAGALVPYRIYAKLAAPILVAAVAALMAVLVIGVERNGAQRWIDLGPVQFQPSELAKFAVVVYLAAAMSVKERLLRRFGHFAVPVLVSLGLVGMLVMFQPDLGTTLIIVGAGLAVLVASAAPIRYVGLTAVVGAATGTLMAFASPERWARITAYMDPFADPLGDGFQAVQSLLALGTGGWFGVGLGASRARWFRLPHAHTDFIFAIIGEETGFAGGLLVLLLFTALAVIGMVVAMRAADQFGRLLAVGLVAWLSLQALVNIGGVTGILPITGVPLPFVSFGGTALVTAMGAVGVLINVSRLAGR